jgi:hypothetical protein
MTPHLAEVIARMVEAKLDAEAGVDGRGTIGSRPARVRRPTAPPVGRGTAQRRGGRR